MIDFKTAIHTATENAQQLLGNATNFQLEEAVVSDDNKRYEITLSYDLTGRDPLSVASSKSRDANSGLMQLARLMSYRKEFKTFYIDKTNGDFKGFRTKK